jgi:hypothetical protein
MLLLLLKGNKSDFPLRIFIGFVTLTENMRSKKFI